MSDSVSTNGLLGLAGLLIALGGTALTAGVEVNSANGIAVGLVLVAAGQAIIFLRTKLKASNNPSVQAFVDATEEYLTPELAAQAAAFLKEQAEARLKAGTPLPPTPPSA